MKDERIETTINHIARRVFFIWYVLTLISLNYRLLILKQHPRDFWDFIAIFFIVSLYGFIAFASKGVFDPGFKTRWLAICIGGCIGIFTLFFIKGRIHSVVDVGALLIGFLPAMGLVIGIAYFLNRRWKRKEGIEDEK
ncbi:MAG TPA: DUF6773 family protein [Sedimentisphaerales bacterium]|nr:DUF6773 family protein [Sedimentisphaerales bacterium]